MEQKRDREISLSQIEQIWSNQANNLEGIDRELYWMCFGVCDKGPALEYSEKKAILEKINNNVHRKKVLFDLLQKTKPSRSMEEYMAFLGQMASNFVENYRQAEGENTSKSQGVVYIPPGATWRSDLFPLKETKYAYLDNLQLFPNVDLFNKRILEKFGDMFGWVPMTPPDFNKYVKEIGKDIVIGYSVGLEYKRGGLYHHITFRAKPVLSGDSFFRYRCAEFSTAASKIIIDRLLHEDWEYKSLL